jgi:hypothetical protein
MQKADMAGVGVEDSTCDERLGDQLRPYRHLADMARAFKWAEILRETSLRLRNVEVTRYSE